MNTQQRYHNNFARHLLSVTLYLQSEIMEALTLKHGHKKLRINYEPYIAIAANRGARLSDIADLLGISSQATNQIANQIVLAGYLRRVPDPSDGRAKLLVTTPRAKTLIKQGVTEARKVQQGFARIIGDDELARASASLISLCGELGLLLRYEDEQNLELFGLMPRLADYVQKRLQTLTMAKGHPALKRSFGPILMAIGPSGGRIQQIADTQDVSKQAVSSTATELEKLGYLRRKPDPDDARQVILLFTSAGKNLIADSVNSTDELAREFTGHMGKPAMAQVKQVLASLYKSLGLEEDIFGHASTHNIHMLARKINRQLGNKGSKILARLLLADETDHFV